MMSSALVFQSKGCQNSRTSKNASYGSFDVHGEKNLNVLDIRDALSRRNFGMLSKVLNGTVEKSQI